MTIPGNIVPLLMSEEAGAGGYQIERSLRFSSIDSAFLSRTPASAGNRKTWTWAGWVKGVVTSENPHLFSCTTGTTDATYFRLWFVSDSIRVSNYNNNLRQTSAVYRDPSAWYHIVLAVDTTQATAANRIKLYVNGSEVTAFSSSVNPNQNDDLGINQAAAHSIGATSAGTATLSGYLADIHFIDGQALDPSSFTEVSATTGQLIPKAYTGSFGTNGFWLKFSDNSAATATTLGKDYSGNNNNWSPSNLSVTAGAGNDSLVDTPTSYGTGNSGGDVRGNFATFNPLASAGTFTNGNLDLDVPLSTDSSGLSTIGFPSSGKWYWETTIVTLGADSYIGISTGESRTSLGNSRYAYRIAGSFQGVPTPTSLPPTASAQASGDIVGVAYDVDNATLAFYKNGTLQGTITGVPANQYFALNYAYSTGTVAQRTINFGQRPFAYTAPSGFKALCDTSLTAPTIARPSTVMDVALWTGNGSARSITGLGFNPDLVWIKGRSGATDHALYDVVRGAQARLESNTTDAEVTSDGGVTAFNSDGFSLGTLAQVNTNSATYAGWTWDAGTSTVTNTQGSITSSVRANPSAGFSIVGWNYPSGTGASTIGHGLGVKPAMIILKNRDGAANWIIYHTSIGATKCFRFTTAAASTESDPWNNTEPTSNVFSIGAASWHGAGNIIAYCFAPVAGYSSFGSYTGNNSADGPFQWCGFRPRWLLIKSAGYAADWIIVDAARETYNVMQKALFPNQSYYEAQASTALRVDFLSNGFKIRSTDGNAEGWNYPSNAHVWAAFAENPFQYARAR